MKAVIVGNSGSGKTWLAGQLGRRLGTEIIHFDDLFWEPGGFDKKRTPDEVSRLVDLSMQTDSWLAEGVFGDLAERYIPVADCLIWLDIEWPVCERRLRTRGSESKAHMGRSQTEAGLDKLIDWASNYRTRAGACSFAVHEQLFNGFQKTRHRLRNEQEVAELLRAPFLGQAA